jgi:hypothetical protein
VALGSKLLLFGLSDWRTHDAYSMLALHSQNPKDKDLIRNSCLLNKQMIIDNSWFGLANTQGERFTLLVVKIKGNDC